MTGLKEISDENLVGWLLEEENPSVRYFTLRDLLDRKEGDPELQAAKDSIPSSRIVAGILSKQKIEGYWEKSTSPYLPKYRSSYWQIMVLGQLGMDRSDERVRRACEYIFGFQLDEGGFPHLTYEQGLEKYESLIEKGKKLPTREEWISSKVFESQLSCLTGNMVAALIRIGYADDPRVKKAVRWLVEIQNQDGGWLCPYWKAHINDTHGCFYGTICPLEAFSEIPKRNLTKEMKQTIEMAAEFFLMHYLFKADHHNYKVINESWLKLSFPWFYRYNILRGLDILGKLGYTEDERLDDALMVLLQKRLPGGKWILESTPSGRMHVSIDRVGKPSKWITLIALRVLKCIQNLDKG
ncbi:MAG: prenyltransferase/squalene oxidase repeat-containing protein [Promethearchaeota archaeon]